MMNEILEFELIPEKLPRGVKRRSRYDIIIDQFFDGNDDSVRVNVKNMKGRELATALRSRVRVRELMDRIRVSQRGEKVYLLKSE